MILLIFHYMYSFSLELINGSSTCKDYLFKRIRLMMKQTFLVILCFKTAKHPRKYFKNYSLAKLNPLEKSKLVVCLVKFKRKLFHLRLSQEF